MFGLSNAAKALILCIATSYGWQTAAFGQQPFEEWEKRQNAEERLTAFGDDLLGDGIDPHTGSIQFQQTDISIPGNSNLAVAITRRRSQGDLYRDNVDEEFGDWELVVPRLKVTVLRAWTGQRCSNDFNTNFPTISTSSAGGSGLTRWEYSNGLYLDTAESGPQQILQVGSRPAPLWPTQATHATLQNWYLKCGSASDGGQGFIGYSPDGTEYRFDRYLSRAATQIGLAGSNSRDRQVDMLAATQVTDVHGNWVKYDYDTSGRLTRIHSNDERSITLTYAVPGKPNLISSVSANGRTWTYSYTQSKWQYESWIDCLPNCRARKQTLDTVALPNGRKWQFSLDKLSATPKPAKMCVTRTHTVSIKHPYGITGTFRLRDLEHRYTYNQYFRSFGFCPDYEEFPATGGEGPPAVDRATTRVMSVTRKQLTGPSIPTMTWSYHYEQDLTNGTSSNDRTNWTKVTGPGVHITYKHKWVDEPEGGSLVSTEYREVDGGPVIETLTNDYVEEVQIATPFAAKYHYKRKPLRMTQSRVARGNDSYTTTYKYNLDQKLANYSWGFPVTVTAKSSTTTRSRINSTKYKHLKNSWILGLPDLVSRNGKEFDKYTYNTNGQALTWSRFGTPWHTYTYHSDGTLATYKNALDEETRFSSFKRGAPQSITLRDGTSIAREIDDNGWVTSETNGRKYTTRFGYNKMGWLNSIDRPDSWADSTITYKLSDTGAVQTLTRGNRREVVTYDNFFRPTLVRRDDLSGSSASIYRSTTYNSRGFRAFTSLPSASANPTDGMQTDYDPLGRIKQTRRMIGGSALSTVSTAYLSGNRIQVTDARGHATTTTYESYGRPQDDPMSGNARPVLIAPPLGATTSIEYDIYGNTTHQRQISGTTVLSETVTAYDSRLRPISVTDPAQDVARTYYDQLDRPIVQIDGESRAVRTVYDRMGRIHKFINAWSGTTAAINDLDNKALNCATMRTKYDAASGVVERCYQTFTYDANGNVDTVTDARGYITRHTYNSLDLPLRTIYPDSSYTEVQAYSNLGDPLRLRTRGGQIHVSKFDGFGRMIAMRTPERDRAFAYDARGLRTCASVFANGTLNFNGEIDCTGTTTNRQHQTTYGFDGAGRMLNETALAAGGPSLRTSYLYDEADNRTRITWPDNFYVTYDYDANNRLQDIKQSGTTLLAHYDYDSQSRLTDITYGGHDYAGGSGTSQTSFGWEVDHDLARLEHKFRATQDVLFTYTHDKSGRMKSESASVNGWLYSPIADKTDLYGTANSLNQYPTVNGLAINHDQNGNRTAYNGLATPHDSENQLTAITIRSSTTSYTYDADGRRVAKANGADTTRFAHAGDMEIAEYVGTTVTQRYIPGHSVDQRVAWIEVSSGVTRYYHANRAGSVQAVVNTSGTVTDQYVYTPFGVEEPLVSTGNPFRYTGRRFDAESGLYYYRARYYDPKHGRFLRTDPLGYADQMNMYAYVHNDPLGYVDPSGMQSCGTKIIGKHSASCPQVAQSRSAQTSEEDKASATVAAAGAIANARANTPFMRVQAQPTPRAPNASPTPSSPRPANDIIKAPSSRPSSSGTPQGGGLGALGRFAGLLGTAIALEQMNDQLNSDIVFRGLSGEDVDNIGQFGAILPRGPNTGVSIEDNIQFDWDSNFVSATRSIEIASRFATSGGDPSGLVAAIDLGRVPGIHYDLSDWRAQSVTDDFLNSPAASIAFSEQLVVIVGPVPVSAINGIYPVEP